MAELNFTLIQTQLHWEDKNANLEMLEQKINAIKEQTHVVILPEMFSTGFSMKPEHLAETMNGPTVQWMKKTAASKKIILTGSVIIEDDGKYFNRLIWMLPNGQYGYYDKRHLFAYGEEDKHYSAGTKRLIASVNGWKINLMVCYDLRFPVWARQSPSPQGEGRGLLRARAIENQCYVIGVNRVGNDGNNIYHSGDSMVIDPLGEILYQKEKDEDVFTIELSKEHMKEVREKFQFWRDADGFEILV